MRGGGAGGERAGDPAAWGDLAGGADPGVHKAGLKLINKHALGLLEYNKCRGVGWRCSRARPGKAGPSFQSGKIFGAGG